MTQEHCRFCNSECHINAAVDIESVQCPQCGNYKIHDYDDQRFNKIPEDKLYLISAYIRRQFDSGAKLEITPDKATEIANLPDMPLAKKMDDLLLAYSKDVASYSNNFDITTKKYIALGCLKNQEEHDYVCSALKERGLAGGSYGSMQHITPAGWIYIDELRKQTDSTQGFVAMWFHNDMNAIYNSTIAPVIVKAGFKAQRIDQKDHNNKIDDEIIAEIQRSRFVVADFTGHRGGVYFEAGYALGRGIPVIWTCKKCCVDDLHFDIRQYNMIVWEENNLDDFKNRLYQRIRATIG